MEGFAVAIIVIVWGFVFGLTLGIRLLASDLLDQRRISFEEYDYIKSWTYIFKTIYKLFINDDSE